MHANTIPLTCTAIESVSEMRRGNAIYENRFGDMLCGCGVWEVVAHLIIGYDLGQEPSTPTTVQWTRGWALQRKQNNNIRNKAQIRLLSYEGVGDGCKGR